MLAFLARRLLGLAGTLLAASLVVFIVLEVLPGDPALVILGVDARPDTLAALRSELGLDRPAPLRYAAWIGGLATGDLGISHTYRVPVAGLIGDRLAVTLPLTLLAIAIAAALAIPLGLRAAQRHNRLADTGVMAFAQLGMAIPNFWFGMLLIVVFSVRLGWFASGGFPGWQDPAAALKALLLPALALATTEAAVLARVTRAAVLDALEEDYVRTALAKGLSRGAVLRRHVLRNALVPVTTVLGLQVGFLLAGAVVVENVSTLPGLGRLVFQAIGQRDLIVIQDSVMVLTALVVGLSFLVDLVQAALDPRPRAAA